MNAPANINHAALCNINLESRKSTPWHYKVLWAIMADPGLKAPSKCVATVLLLKYHNHKTGQCNPSYSTVGKLLGRDRRNVINAINDLRAGGWIEWMGTKGGSSSNTNAFKFKMNGPASTGDEVVTPTGDELVTLPVTKSSPVMNSSPVMKSSMRGDELVTLPVTKSSHDLSIELSKNHKESCRVAKATPTKNEYSEDFETNFWKPFPRTPIMAKKEAWQAYPRRDGGNPKSPAAKLFLAAVKAGTDPKMIIDAAARFAIAEQRNVGTPFIPQMVKWMRDRRWLDYGPGTSATIINIRGSFI